MKAMLLRKSAPIEKAPLEVAEVPTPEPDQGQVRVRVSACAICHTDLHVVEGEIKGRKMPVVPGHQIVGVVDKTGKGVTRLRPGQRVGIPWLHSTCGRCDFCKAGRENLCKEALFTGYDLNGGYAEYTVAPEDFAYPLPDRFSGVQAAPLLCAGIIGFRSLRLSGIQAGQNLGLYGFGASAHITIQLAVHRGCKVYVFTRGAEHQRLARELGAVWAGRAEEMPNQSLHGAIIFAPAGSIVPYALEALERGGTVTLAGIYMSTIPELDYSKHLYQEKVLRSVSNATRQDATDFLRLAADVPVRSTIQTFRPEQANEALQLLKAGRIQGAAVLEL